ncbi:hypothetical protein P886_1712 [Alteromonadaceae bacterium 2753L.S.0a.02]|nr:hypothetical protein P886_1712 [Alteromonadaceae bacterium 2753L.S.0a.02]
MGNLSIAQQLNNGIAGNTHLAEVVAVNDPDGKNRVQIKLLSYDDATDQDAPVWARVAVPFAGNDRGAFLIPDVGDEVLVSFVNGDTRMPVVIGSLWNGADSAPESLPGDSVDRWTFTGKAGTRIAIVEESSGSETIKFSTPSGTTGELTDAGGGKVEFVTGGNTITMDSSGVTVNTSANVQVQATMVQISASMVTVDAGMSKFSGVVQADTVITNSCIAASYTPGAGNIW